MLQKINMMICKSRVCIFICAALYKLTFWIINMVNNFISDGRAVQYGSKNPGNGVYTLFHGLFEMIFYLVILAVILEVSRKIAEKYTQAELAPAPKFNNYNAAPQAPVQPQMQVPPQAPQAPQPQAPVQAPSQPVNAAPSGVWYCANCGTQNNGTSAFCFKCGKPK